MSRLEEWLDSECELIESQLRWSNRLTEREIKTRVDWARQELTNTYRGRSLQLADAWDDLKRAVRRAVSR